MSTIRASVPDALLVVAGAGSERERLEARTKTLGLAHAVRFQGFIPDETLPAAYAAADLNVLPSIALEGFGLTAVEALAAGTPSIVTPIGGMPEIVTPLSRRLVSDDPNARRPRIYDHTASLGSR